jgi:hypothetical protein
VSKNDESKNFENWALDEHVGRLRSRQLQAEIDLTRPDRGIHAVHLKGRRLPGSRLRLSCGDDRTSQSAPVWSAQLTDAYVRGHDLVVSYSGTDAWPYSPTVYWSADSISPNGADCDSLSLLVSIQTDLLDTQPRLDVCSSLPADEVQMVSVVDDDLLVDSHGEGVQAIDPRATACGLIWRLPGESVSYVEIMPTADFRRFSIDRDSDSIGSCWELFGEFLEKGVIRRARLQSLFVPREDDVQLAAEACQSIERRPLPLTT